MKSNMIYLFIGQLSSKLYKEYSMLKENIVLKQWSPQITVRTSSQKQHYFSYSRHLSMQFDNSDAETKQNHGNRQEGHMILRPSWAKILKGQNSNRKDEMLKILKGKNYKLELIQKKKKQNNKKDIIKTPPNKSWQKSKQNKQSMKYERQRKKWCENSRKYLNKTLRVQNMLNQLITDHL